MVKRRSMTRVRTFLACGVAAAAGLALTAAQRPAALAQVSGGLWEIDLLGPGARPRICVADPLMLAQYEHRAEMCTRVVISDTPPSTLIHYTCPGQGFGRSKLTVITPRSIRIETQGISGGYPFNYVLQARRVGECNPRQAMRAH
jgi:hypothetical protein